MILRDGVVHFILDPTPPGDADGDGVEDRSPIMQVYEHPTSKMLAAFETGRATVEDQVYTDPWGTFLSGYAPFFTSDGTLAGVVGLDIAADDYLERLEPIRRATIRAVVTGWFAAFLVGAIIWFVRHFTREINQKRLAALRHFAAQRGRP